MLQLCYHPPRTRTVFFPITLSSTHPRTIAHAPTAYVNLAPPLYNRLKCPSCVETLVKPKKPSSAMTASAPFISSVRPSHVMLLKDCARRTPGVAIPLLPGSHLLSRPISPCAVQCNPTPYLPPTPCPTMELWFLCYKMTRACSRLGKLQIWLDADPGKETRPGGSITTNPWLRHRASGHKRRSHNTAMGRWLMAYIRQGVQ